MLPPMVHAGNHDVGSSSESDDNAAIPEDQVPLVAEKEGRGRVKGRKRRKIKCERPKGFCIQNFQLSCIDTSYSVVNFGRFVGRRTCSLVPRPARRPGYQARGDAAC